MLRNTCVALAAAASLLALPAGASALTPKSGYYEGQGVFFKVAKFGERPQLARVAFSGPLTCADGSTRTDTLDRILILGPKVGREGRFRYEGTGVVFKGRFTSRTQAHGRLTRAEGDCSSVTTWTATLKTGGIPIPTA